MKKTIFITGTDTGVGKTVVTALLAEYLRMRGVKVAAVKPVCSGGREDAHILHEALGGTLSIDEINPWHFRAPVAPLLAAKKEHKKLSIAPVLAHVSAISERFDVLLVEGAGGLLSPLGVDFDSRDLITAIRAAPVIVAPNRLGAVNHILLTLEALPKSSRTCARIVLATPEKPDTATASNASLLERSTVKGISRLPWLGKKISARTALRQAKIRTTLGTLINQMANTPTGR